MLALASAAITSAKPSNTAHKAARSGRIRRPYDRELRYDTDA
jgi:hypothetical protein